MKVKLLLLMLFMGVFSWGQTTVINFDATTSWIDGGSGLASYDTDHSYSSNNWFFTSTNGLRNGTTAQDGFAGALGTYSWRLRDAVGNWTGTYNSAGTITNFGFSSRRWDNSPAANYTVEYSINSGSTWTNVGTLNYTTSDWVIFSHTLSTDAIVTSGQFIVRVSRVSGERIFIDDFSFTTSSATPTITLTPTSLSSFTYVVGNGPSAEQTFTASGVNLTADIVVSAPTNYEISTTSGSGFGASVTLTQASGTVAATTIYTRLKLGLSVNAYNETITATSTGASNKTVTLTGNVTGSTASDVIAVTSSEAVTISSTINNPAPLTSSTGVQVWQFKVRDGGATLNDADNLPTILTAFTLAQDSGNSVSTWSDAIRTVALFDGTTFIATGTVTGTQIQFTGLSVSVADNTEKTLSLRLSLKCPLGADAFDGEDFVFSLSNSNTTFSATGSGKTAFTAQVSANGSNAIDVVATNLAFLVQPVTTGVNGPMNPAVQIRTIDACGNFDSGFSGTVSITSTGTMSSSPVSAVAVSGIATFNTLTHTVSGTGYVLNATSSGLTGATSTTFDIDNVTVLQPGDIAILAFNTGVTTGEDEISFVNLVDILPGTRIDLTDNAYQKCGTPNGWGISEGWIRLERANSTLPAGTIVTIRVDGGTGVASIYSPDPSNWTCSKPQPSGQGLFNLNNSGEQIFFMSGGTVGGTNSTSATSDGGTYSGNFLFGFNTKGNVWTPICGNSAAGGTQNSDKPSNFDCFLTWPTAQADLNKYTGLLTPTTKRDWIERINNPSNWTGYADNTAYDAGPNYYSGTIVINAGGYTDGVWVGSASDNWFDCSNWQALKLPDENVNVVLDSNSMQGVRIDYTAPFSDLFTDIAKCRNLDISNFSVQIESDVNNILTVYGNLSLSGTGSLDMDDSNTSTADGVLKLYGNWTNSLTNTAFEEGNGTVQFLGTSPQIINAVAPLGTESFYNVVLGNNFDTAVSNDLIATGDLTINSGKSVSIDTNGYIYAYNKLSNNGTFNIENNGQLIQVNETDTNDGVYTGTNFGVKRIAFVNKDDYVYWASPVNGFDVSNILFGPRYVWNTVFPNSNGTFGNWVVASGTMEKGKGYIVKVPDSSPVRPAIPAQQLTHFYGKPNNGQFTFGIDRYTDATSIDDNWNLIGNPYPSAIFAEEFLEANDTKIAGSVWVWKHGQSPTNAVDPFYYDFSGNYYSNDYLKYNKLGASDTTFNGIIASGQGFLVNMLESASIPGNTVVFNNAMRTVVNPDFTLSAYDNSIFYRNSNGNKSVSSSEEKHRIWLDIINVSNNQTDTNLLGYSTNSSLAVDHFYDCVFVPRTEVAMYSLIGTGEYIIQGRPLPFMDSDLVPMGVKIVDAGNHTIAIKKIDGLFESSQDIYLEDKLLNIIHDLKAAPYNFTSEVGVFNDRFVVRYTATALSNDDFNSINSSVIVASQDSEIAIKSGAGLISSVSVYDILGREIVKKKNINNSEITLNNVSAKNQALIVRITLENGQVVARKIIL